MDIRSMRYILEVLKTKSFTTAAAKLYLSPQAIGKTVREAEAELGAPLFVREKQHLIPTKLGAAFAKEAERCVQQFDQAQMRIAAMARQAKGCVCVACAYGVPNALGYESPDILREMIDEETSCGVDVAVNELPDLYAERELCEEAADIALLTGCPEPEEQFEKELLCVNRLVAVVRGDHPLAGREKISIREMAAYPVACKNRYYRSYHILEQCAAKQQIRLRYAVCTPDDSLWRRKVLGTDAVGIGVSFLKPSARADGMSVIAFEEEEMAVPIYLVRKKDHPLEEPAVRLWMRIVNEQRGRDKSDKKE